MNIIGIIKDAFLFPSKNTGRFAIYLLLSVLMIGFAIGGVLTCAFGLLDAVNYFTGGLYLIISMLIGFIIAGYHINIIKSGIELSEEVPAFKLFENFMTGFENIVVTIAYLIIPGFLALLVAYDADLFGKVFAIVQEVVLQIYNVFIMGNSANLAVNAISHTVDTFLVSLATTIAFAIILFVIASIIQSIALARLANTGSLSKALDISESLIDITRIGIGKVILVAISVFVIIALIEIILIVVLNNYPFLLTIIFIILTPYLALVAQRSLGLLYSDIA